jgi:hypothetical protein
MYCMNPIVPCVGNPIYISLSICQLLHHLLLKLEPVEYKRREKEVLGECPKHKGKPLSV